MGINPKLYSFEFLKQLKHDGIRESKKLKTNPSKLRNEKNIDDENSHHEGPNPLDEAFGKNQKDSNPIGNDEISEHKSKSLQNQLLDELRLNLLKISTCFGVFVPIFAVLLPQILIGPQPFDLVLIAAFCSISSALNHLVFKFKGNLLAASGILSSIVLLSFIACVLRTGGLHSEYLIFGPTIVALIGFLTGPKGALISSGSLVLVTGFVVLSDAAMIYSGNSQTPSILAAIELTLSLVTIGGITWLHESFRAKTNKRLFDLNATLAAEKKHLSETAKALELEKIKSIQNSKLASLGEMSACIAHEINNPVGIICGSVRLLKKDNKSDDGSRTMFLGEIEKASLRISKIVGGLTRFSRKSSPLVDYKNVAVKDILDEVYILTQGKAKAHFVEVKIECPPSLLIYCDQIEIEQVFFNMVNNAIDAVFNLDLKWVHIKACEIDGFIEVTVKDSGTSLSKEIKEQMFQPFFTTKPLGQGTGLGLAIVSEILGHHHASVNVKMDEIHTCFEIRFPKIKGIISVA